MNSLKLLTIRETIILTNKKILNEDEILKILPQTVKNDYEEEKKKLNAALLWEHNSIIPYLHNFKITNRRRIKITNRGIIDWEHFVEYHFDDLEYVEKLKVMSFFCLENLISKHFKYFKPFLKKFNVEIEDDENSVHEIITIFNHFGTASFLKSECNLITVNSRVDTKIILNSEKMFKKCFLIASISGMKYFWKRIENKKKFLDDFYKLEFMYSTKYGEEENRNRKDTILFLYNVMDEKQWKDFLNFHASQIFIWIEKYGNKDLDLKSINCDLENYGYVFCKSKFDYFYSPKIWFNLL